MKSRESSFVSRPNAGKSLANSARPAGGSGAAAPERQTSAAPAARTTTILYADGSTLDWRTINNGRGMRVNIVGSLDFSLRAEWARLLDEPMAATVEEYEFNLADSPELSLAGLGMLLLFRERKMSGQSKFVLKNCSSSVAEVLSWTGMDRFFTIYTAQPPES